ncbi:hypothetical protein GYA93_05730 [Gordonia desulfuricans]|uniref:Uncharacterized protein n=1 Tax=Gordonia desulfuricans TaxID=89051 RepID=A0A7K3LLP5_9ACTN|nr:hypothetical protein [Gordonia desulfuricans]NDK89083.1 hypothetical protein [Gordonia desulfuricans]
MTAPRTDSLAALRDQAIRGVEDLIAVLGTGRLLGMHVPGDDEIRSMLTSVGGVDVDGLAADARRLASAHRAVADRLHRLPEQQVRLDAGWVSEAGRVVLGLVIEHQRRAEADLHALRSVSDAANAAAAGIDQILRTWYLTVARLSSPMVAGVPVPEIPARVLTGEIPLQVVIDDVGSRITLLRNASDSARQGIGGVLAVLSRTSDTWDDGELGDPRGQAGTAVRAELPDDPHADRRTAGPDTDRAGAPPAGIAQPVDVPPAADVPFTLASDEPSPDTASSGASAPRHVEPPANDPGPPAGRTTDDPGARPQTIPATPPTGSPDTTQSDTTQSDTATPHVTTPDAATPASPGVPEPPSRPAPPVPDASSTQSDLALAGDQ